jgi:hypothetical protein
MDESGNKESDRFFVVGFLELENLVEFNTKLYRIHEQVLHFSKYRRMERVNLAYQQKDLDTLFNFAKSYVRFELKFYKVSPENIRLFQDLVKALFKKIDFRFNAIVIDRADPDYTHIGLYPMYKTIINVFSHHCIQSDFVFVPDMFDYRFDWYDMNYSSKVKAIIPTTSDSSFPLQVVDVLTGIISLGLKYKYYDDRDLTNNDLKRKPLLVTLEEELGKKIDKRLTVNYPKYFSVWTVDFSKRKGSRHGQETQP